MWMNNKSRSCRKPLSPFPMITSAEIFNIINCFKGHSINISHLMTSPISCYSAIKTLYEQFNSGDLDKLPEIHRRIFKDVGKCDWNNDATHCSKKCLWSQFAYEEKKKNCYDLDMAYKFWDSLDNDTSNEPLFTCPIVLLKIVMVPTFTIYKNTGDISHEFQFSHDKQINRRTIEVMKLKKSSGSLKVDSLYRDADRLMKIYQILLPHYSEEMLLQLLPTSANCGINKFLSHYFKYIYYQFNKLMTASNHAKKTVNKN